MSPAPRPLPMQVILAAPRGFCAGVVRAVDIVERTLAKHGAPVHVRHEIVHNRHVVDRLRGKGAVFVDELDEVPEGSVAIFSAHGVSRAVEREGERRRLSVIDATCPLVAKVHGHARRYSRSGRTLVLIGHRGHAEVEGTVGQVDAPVHVVASAAEVAALPIAPDRPVAYLTQTTLSVDDTRTVIAALKARFSDLIGPDVSDICYATQNRQRAVRDLAPTCDVLLVVGAPNSSNANRLREIGAELGVASFLVEDGADVDPAWITTAATVGITAGASTPEAQVRDVVAALACVREVIVTEQAGIVEDQTFALPSALRRPAAAIG